jgi:hypothetical protein
MKLRCSARKTWVAPIAAEDAVMEADMRLVGLGDAPMEPVHQPAMERILEQVRVQDGDDESDRGTYDDELICHGARRLRRRGAQVQAFYVV